MWNNPIYKALICWYFMTGNDTGDSTRTAGFSLASGISGPLGGALGSQDIDDSYRLINPAGGDLQTLGSLGRCLKGMGYDVVFSDVYPSVPREDFEEAVRKLAEGGDPWRVKHHLHEFDDATD